MSVYNKIAIALFLLSIPFGSEALTSKVSEPLESEQSSAFSDLNSLISLNQSIQKKKPSKSPFLYLEHYKRGVCYKKLGFTDEAIHDFNRSLDLFPDHLPSHIALADIFFSLENWPRVIDILNIAEKNRFSSFSKNFQRGLCHYHQQNYLKALNDFETALKMNQYPNEIFEFIVLSYINLYKYELALEKLILHKESFKEKNTYHFYKGLIYFFMYKSKEWDIYKNNFKKGHENNSLLIDLKKRVQVAFREAIRNDFCIHSYGEWKKIIRLREHLDELLNFLFTAQEPKPLIKKLH
ncbi:hypothetical protein AB834_02485 [PVC group bacterium (ex Bugula neritina AB1)]|nr:hypothetical protein AB834_02485 [PVC group bacterium (ex Bugula neritina AB1)]